MRMHKQGWFAPLFVIGFLFISFIAQAQEAKLMPRTVVVLYDSLEEAEPYLTRAHLLAEMPLNHLGLVAEYHDIQKGLPDVSNREDVRGVLTWLPSGTEIPDTSAYITWAADLIDSGKKYVSMGDFGLHSNQTKSQAPLGHINHLLRKMGMKDTDDWVQVTYDVKFAYRDPAMTGFERRKFAVKPPYERFLRTRSTTKVHLVARENKEADTDGVLIATGPWGGYVADGYAVYTHEHEDGHFKQWFINPFRFFQIAFATDELPKPDTTTLAGRRIYYSHIDGDGWNNLTRLEEYQNQYVLSSQVILDKVIKPNPGLPVTVAPIAADLDDKWVGNEKSRRTARALFRLPQVEVGSHTYSHPFYWQFFADQDSAEKEKPFLTRYKTGHWQAESLIHRAKHLLAANGLRKALDATVTDLPNGYKTPRAFANRPFKLDREIAGAVDVINALAPKGKTTQILMWSGNTSPFPAAMKKVRQAGLLNINGGDTRFDVDFNSYAWVAPVGRITGAERQIYASMSNENTYTEGWKAQYHGFRYLAQTLHNTETPIRIKPFNVYYHMYSGERRASLDALLANIDLAKRSEIAPITASHFAAIAGGFYKTKLFKTEDGRWEVADRGALQTLRFDNQDGANVDFARSEGVIGQRHYQGSLYVYLDAAVAKPRIALQADPHGMGKTLPYLQQSRWQVWHLARNEGSIQFTAQGFGPGEMVWHLQPNQSYHIKTVSLKNQTSETTATSDAEGNLALKLDVSAIRPISVLIESTLGGRTPS